MGDITRRQFLKWLTALGIGLAGGAACGGRPERAPTWTPTDLEPPTTVPPSQPGVPAATSTSTSTPAPVSPPAQLAVARGPDPAEITRRAIAALGGIEQFVKPGDEVIVKPNICNAYHGPEYASTTHPDVVAAIVALCLGAGARRVRVMDYPFGGTAQAAYAKSGIEAAVQASGGEMEVMSRLKYRTVDLPAGRALKKTAIYDPILEADVLINVPIAKHHGSARLTLGMKNLMGVVLDRGAFHAKGLHQCIADLNSLVRPHLTVVDAVRILMANGPTGGNLNDVKQMDTVIAGADVVATDAYAATLFGQTGSDIEHIRLGAEMGLGELDLTQLYIVHVQ